MRSRPSPARREHHRLQHLPGFHAHEAPIVVGREVADGRSEGGAGIPHDCIAEAFLLDLQLTRAVGQRERRDDVVVDAIDFAVEADFEVVFAPQYATGGAVFVVAALQAALGFVVRRLSVQFQPLRAPRSATGGRWRQNRPPSPSAGGPGPSAGA